MGRLLFEYFWVLALGATVLNYYQGKRSRTPPASQVEAQEAERYLVRGLLIMASPWVLMGIGQLTGSTGTVVDYFSPLDGNPFVVAWIALVLAIHYWFAGWVLLAGGAEKVRDLNLLSVAGFSGDKPPTIQTIKAVAAIAMIVPSLWLLIAITRDTAVPG